MINRDHGQMQLACDDCGAETTVYDEEQFNEMISSAKDDGWKISCPQGRWEHHCKDCSHEGGALAAARRKFGLS